MLQGLRQHLHHFAHPQNPIKHQITRPHLPPCALSGGTVSNAPEKPQTVLPAVPVWGSLSGSSPTKMVRLRLRSSGTFGSSGRTKRTKQRSAGRLFVDLLQIGGTLSCKPRRLGSTASRAEPVEPSLAQGETARASWVLDIKVDWEKGHVCQALKRS